MVNRIFFEGGDSECPSPFWAEGFDAPAAEFDTVEPVGDCLDSGLCIVRDRPAVHPLARGGTAFVPEYYEMNYPYPLIVWLAAPNASPDDFERRMTAVSPRNCLGLQVPIETAWDTRQVLEAVRESVAELRQTWHVHTERIFPAGDGPGAEAALRTFLARPEWFGGAIVLGGRFGEAPRMPVRNHALRGKRVLLASRDGKPAAETESHRTLARMLNAAGLAVTLRRQAADSLEGPTALSDVNAWLMEAICVAA
jgi:phospholipase/carboxylesterase